MNWSILDSGATSNFLVSDAPVLNKKPRTSPLNMKLPNVEQEASNNTCDMDLPQPQNNSLQMSYHPRIGTPLANFGNPIVQCRM